MTIDADIYRAARRLLDEHGERAVFRAMDRARELAGQDDEDGAITWVRIARAIRELSQLRLPEETVH